MPECKARQHSDSMVCSCGNTWDVNDGDPPRCPGECQTPAPVERIRCPKVRMEGSGQTRLASAAEAATNVAVGYALAVLTQSLVFPLFGLHATTPEHMALALVFTVISLVRSYCLRRLFNGWGRRR